MPDGGFSTIDFVAKVAVPDFRRIRSTNDHRTKRKEEGDAFEEEYPLEDLEISTSDFVAKVVVPDFRMIRSTKDHRMKITEKGDTFEEEHLLEDLEISTSDFVAKVAVPDFRRALEQMSNANDVLERFALQLKKLGNHRK